MEEIIVFGICHYPGACYLLVTREEDSGIEQLLWGTNWEEEHKLNDRGLRFMRGGAGAHPYCSGDSVEYAKLSARHTFCTGNHSLL